MSGLDLCDDFRPDQGDRVMPEEGFVVKQGDLGSQGLVEVINTRE